MNNITYFNDTIDKTEYDKVVAERDNLKQMLEHSRNANVTLNNRIDSFKEEIKTFVVENIGGYVSDDDLKNFAESFGIELTQDVTFTATVSFSVSATVPLDFDLDEIENLDFTASLDYNGSDLQDLEFDYSEVVIEDVEV